MSDSTLCGDEYTACQENSDCAGYETCRNDNCLGLTGDAWVSCENACNAQTTHAAIALWYTFENCINCDACAYSCGSLDGVYCDASECDGNDCYTECWGCAMETTCADEVAACNANTDCTGLEACRIDNCYGLTGEAWTACVSYCESANPGGVPLLNAYHECIYCEGCPISCAADAAGKC